MLHRLVKTSHLDKKTKTEQGKYERVALPHAISAKVSTISLPFIPEATMRASPVHVDVRKTHATHMVDAKAPSGAHDILYVDDTAMCSNGRGLRWVE